MTTDKTKASIILDTASNLLKERGKQRDSEEGERSMAATVKAFNALKGTTLSEVDGWQFMELLKISRSCQGGHQPDDYIDGAAYAALAGEAADTD